MTKPLTARVDYEEMYEEGDWKYIRVSVDGEQVGFAALNFRTKRVGRNLHHPDSYPNDEVLEALSEVLGCLVARSK